MLQMKLCGDLVLREKCQPIAEITPDILGVLDEMAKMMETQNGVGLAAPQVGILQRFIIMLNPDTKEVFKMLNPEITWRSEDNCTMEEGCLSVLGGDDLPVYANVTRPESIEIRWMNENGDIMHGQMRGVAARIAQHEIDHLDGVLFMDYLSPLRREMLMRKVRKRKE